jgi:hypothetical protein
MDDQYLDYILDLIEKEGMAIAMSQYSEDVLKLLKEYKKQKEAVLEIAQVINDDDQE